jgi:hypothetical protein
MKRLILACVFLLLALPLSAQTAVTNPGHVEFTASVDHALIDKYVIGWFAQGATDPIQETDLGKPTPDGANLVSTTINIHPLGFGIYTAKVKAVVGAVSSEWSVPSNEAVRGPFPPASPSLKK